ncbi:MAG: hypothetical protein ACJA1L_001736 [Paracoccaceae bacterium]|jgi:hypothetical protein
MTLPENSDRGFTIAKPFVWSMLSAMLVGGIWVGSLRGALEETGRRVDRTEERVSSLEVRQGAAERETAIVATRVELILRVVERTDARVARMEIEAAARGRDERPKPGQQE